MNPGVEDHRFYLQYFFPPSSVGETGRTGGAGRWDSRRHCMWLRVKELKGLEGPACCTSGAWTSCSLGRVCRRGLQPATTRAGASLLCSLTGSCMVLKRPHVGSIDRGGPCIMRKQQRSVTDQRWAQSLLGPSACLQERDRSRHAGTASSESRHPYSGKIKLFSPQLFDRVWQQAYLPASLRIRCQI